MNCWYFKINQRVEQMDQMLKNQQEIIRLLGDKTVETVKEKAEETAEEMTKEAEE